MKFSSSGSSLRSLPAASRSDEVRCERVISCSVTTAAPASSATTPADRKRARALGSSAVAAPAAMIAGRGGHDGARTPRRNLSVSEHFQVRGGARLVGEVDVVGAKNSVLKLMAAALLAEGTTTLTNVPEILDVPYMADVLRSL